MVHNQNKTHLVLYEMVVIHNPINCSDIFISSEFEIITVLIPSTPQLYVFILVEALLVYKQQKKALLSPKKISGI